MAAPNSHSPRGPPNPFAEPDGATQLGDVPKGRHAVKAKRADRTLLPLPGLDRSLSASLPQYRSRGPRHDAALGNPAIAARRHQPNALRWPAMRREEEGKPWQV